MRGVGIRLGSVANWRRLLFVVVPLFSDCVRVPCPWKLPPPPNPPPSGGGPPPPTKNPPPPPLPKFRRVVLLDELPFPFCPAFKAKFCPCNKAAISWRVRP